MFALRQKEAKEDFEELQVEFNVLEDDRDGLRERAKGLQGKLDDMTTAQDCLLYDWCKYSLCGSEW